MIAASLLRETGDSRNGVATFPPREKTVPRGPFGAEGGNPRGGRAAAILASSKAGCFAELLHWKDSFRWLGFLLLSGTAESGALKPNALPGEGEALGSPRCQGRERSGRALTIRRSGRSGAGFGQEGKRDEKGSQRWRNCYHTKNAVPSAGKPHVQCERRTEASMRATLCASSDPTRWNPVLCPLSDHLAFQRSQIGRGMTKVSFWTLRPWRFFPTTKCIYGW
jgi:hypothetical protein